jgi:hypothetical protein
MATAKTFSVAGVSTLNGVTKVRFANDYVGRFKILAKNGHQDINLIELGSELTQSTDLRSAPCTSELPG